MTLGVVWTALLLQIPVSVHIGCMDALHHTCSTRGLRTCILTPFVCYKAPIDISNSATHLLPFSDNLVGAFANWFQAELVLMALKGRHLCP